MRYPEMVVLRVSLVLIVLAGYLFSLGYASSAAASGDLVRYHEKGVLHAIEKHNAQLVATIDDRDFVVDREGILVVIDGKPAALKDIIVPKEIEFEYVIIEKNRGSEPVVVYVTASSHERKNEGGGK